MKSAARIEAIGNGFEDQRIEIWRIDSPQLEFATRAGDGDAGSKRRRSRWPEMIRRRRELDQICRLLKMCVEIAASCRGRWVRSRARALVVRARGEERVRELNLRARSSLKQFQKFSACPATAKLKKNVCSALNS